MDASTRPEKDLALLKIKSTSQDFNIGGLFSYCATEEGPLKIALERPPSTELISDALGLGFSSVFNVLLSLIVKNDLDFTKELHDLVRKVVEALSVRKP